MTDEQEPGAAAPFDAIPEVPPTAIGAPEADGAAGAAAPQRLGRKLGLPGGLVVIAIALGFGQSLALLTFFGDDDRHLSAPHDSPPAAPAPRAAATAPATDAKKESATDAKAAAPANGAAAPADVDAAASATPAPRAPDAIDTARDMLDRGDVSGARRIATAYLLRVDGMSRTERERESAAYAVLGDAMRKDYELAIATGGTGGGDR